MNYTKVIYYPFFAVLLLVYYCLPGKFRWCVLLAGSMAFYWMAVKNPLLIGAFLAMIVLSYGFGVLIGRTRSKAVMAAGIILTAAPLLAFKATEYGALSSFIGGGSRLILPLGASFFTLQMIAYLADIYKGKIPAQKNPLKYALFISFFPHIIQGPIPRYSQLGAQLTEPHRFESENLVRGFHLILWGVFLKFMIADKAGVVVDTVFANTARYQGMYVLTAGALYSIQLYTDFMSCTYMSRGAARCTGIDVISNFDHPYFATSIKDFWRRWHISLSTWLRDYVYIPLGGNRRGKFFKYVNLVLTFAVSGIWHGGSLKFLFWGLLHAFYQIAGEFTYRVRECLYSAAKIEKTSYLKHIIKSAGTFFLAMTAWIIFRADSLRQALEMIRSMFTVHNYWIFWDDSLFTLGLEWKEWGVLLHSMALLFVISYVQTKLSVSSWILRQHVIVRWSIYIGAVLTVMIFGTYGFGYDAKDFIYGGF